MNAFLVQIFSFLNALLATIIIGGGVVVLGIAILYGHQYFDISLEPKVLASLIIVGSIVLAVSICGLMAILCEIERHLRDLKSFGDQRSKRDEMTSSRLSLKL